MNFRFIIMAAGRGTRMGADVPKALVTVAGKPIIQHIYESVTESKVDGIPVIVVGHERTKLCAAFNGECEYVVQEEQLGTAHAVMVCKDAVQGADAVIVLNGDHPLVSAVTLRKLAELHTRVGGVLTMMTTTVPSFEEWSIYSHWGRVVRDAHGHIIAIREYKDAMQSEQEIREVNPSFFCFDASWLWENIGQVKNYNANNEYYLTDLIELAVAQGHEITSMSISPEEAVGINTQAEVEIAERILSKRNG
ncbi:MAG: NTP transferase domain-containing protein [Parcubacteria group bacterium]|nr:NTP transferase domain-containing protein [Parcubacteria group bacterium]